MGRIYCMKMNILARILYLFRTLPIKYPKTEEKSLQRAMDKFIWEGKKARISRKLLQKSKYKGGVGVPDLFGYYKAAQFAQVQAWHMLDGQPCWVTLEQALIQDTKLSEIMWKPTPSAILKHGPPCIAHSLQLWAPYKYRDKLCKPKSLMTPLLQNPTFLPGTTISDFRWWAQNGITKVGDLLTGSRVKSFNTLKEKYNIPPREHFRYLQITHWVNTLLRGGCDGSYSKYESECKKGMKTKGTISRIYYHMIHETNSNPPKFQEQWSTDLNHPIEEEAWEEVYENISRISTNTLLKENGYKTIARWYMTPQKLHKIQNNIPPTCFRGCGEIGTYMHMWWECPQAKNVWELAFQEINACYGLTPEPKIALLNLFPIEAFHNESAKRLIIKICSATRMVIARHWKGPIPQAWAAIEAKLGEIMVMETITALINNKVQKFREIWYPYISRHPINTGIDQDP
uniref:Reverse transcriptase zinc-binding domain-containing protein n=1 Tax=Xenopus tropicalis TaxID=8364 RepID=A0A803JAI9_XENTR